jgi:hypothetical protein
MVWSYTGRWFRYPKKVHDLLLSDHNLVLCEHNLSVSKHNLVLCVNNLSISKDGLLRRTDNLSMSGDNLVGSGDNLEDGLRSKGNSRWRDGRRREILLDQEILQMRVFL